MALGNQKPLFGQAKIIPVGDSCLVVLEVTMGNPYAAGGIAISAADFGLRSLDICIPLCSGAGYTVSWDQANSKIKMYQQPAVAGAGPHTEVGAVDLSAVKVYVLGIGKR